MFESLKQLIQLGKLKQLRENLEKEKIKIEKQGVEVIVNGKMELEMVKLNPQLEIALQEKIVKDCINEAIREIQKSLLSKMMKNF